MPGLPQEDTGQGGLLAQDSKLSYRQLFTLVLAWQRRCTPGDVVTLVGLSHPTAESWFSKLRDH